MSATKQAKQQQAKPATEGLLKEKGSARKRLSVRFQLDDETNSGPPSSSNTKTSDDENEETTRHESAKEYIDGLF